MNTHQKQSFLYVFGRIGPAALNVAATSIFTRLSAPENYAVVVLATSAAQMGSIAVFQWLRASLTRFHHAKSEGDLTATVNGLFLAQIGVAAAVTALICTFFVRQSDTLALVAACLLMLAGQSWFDLCQEFQRARQQPVRYGLAFAVRSVLGLVLGVITLRITDSGYLLASALLASLLLAPLPFMTVPEGGHGRFDPALARELLIYGLPLGAASLLTSVAGLGDRFIVASLLSPALAGVYGPSVDLGRQTLLVLLQAFSLAALPIALRSLEVGGRPAVVGHLNRTVDLLVWAALPAALAFSMLHAEIAQIMLGPKYRGAAAMLLPLVALSALVTGVRTFYFDLAAQLARDTKRQVIVAAVTCGASLVLTIALTMRLGLFGAALSAVLAQSLGLAASIYIGSKVFPMPFPFGRAVRSVTSVIAMAAVLAMLQRFWPGISVVRTLALVVAGGGIYLIASFALDAGPVREASRWIKVKAAAQLT